MKTRELIDARLLGINPGKRGPDYTLPTKGRDLSEWTGKGTESIQEEKVNQLQTNGGLKGADCGVSKRKGSLTSDLGWERIAFRGTSVCEDHRDRKQYAGSFTTSQ